MTRPGPRWRSNRAAAGQPLAVPSDGQRQRPPGRRSGGAAVAAGHEAGHGAAGGEPPQPPEWFIRARHVFQLFQHGTDEQLWRIRPEQKLWQYISISTQPSP